MSKDLAKEIASWKYEDECSIYNLPSWEQMKNKVENQGLLARIPYDIAFN